MSKTQKKQDTFITPRPSWPRRTRGVKGSEPCTGLFPASGICLTLPLHEGLEEATQLLGGWGPLPRQQPARSLQAFPLQIPLLLPQLLAPILPGKGRDESPAQASLPSKGNMSAQQENGQAFSWAAGSEGGDPSPLPGLSPLTVPLMFPEPR